MFTPLTPGLGKITSTNIFLRGWSCQTARRFLEDLWRCSFPMECKFDVNCSQSQPNLGFQNLPVEGCWRNCVRNRCVSIVIKEPVYWRFGRPTACPTWYLGCRTRPSQAGCWYLIPTNKIWLDHTQLKLIISSSFPSPCFLFNVCLPWGFHHGFGCPAHIFDGGFPTRFGFQMTLLERSRRVAHLNFWAASKYWEAMADSGCANFFAGTKGWFRDQYNPCKYGIFTIIYLHGWLIFMVNVEKFTSPMEAMGNVFRIWTGTFCRERGNISHQKREVWKNHRLQECQKGGEGRGYVSYKEGICMPI